MAMEITMARGDLERRTILLKNRQGETWTTVPDEIYFTVKKSANDRMYTFQKTLTGGGITFIETGKYQVEILPDDTNELNFGTFDFDIEVVVNGLVKKTFTGKLILEKEVTHYYNERYL